MDHYEIVNKLIGPIEPVGESHIDTSRWANLCDLIILIERLMDDLLNIAQRNNAQEHSIKAIADSAYNYLISLKEVLEENLKNT
jgi:hypothetical protein